MAHEIVGAGVVAKRMCDLLQSFPAAASGGVQWRTLVSKYEERHATQLDVKCYGFNSPLAAATSLLWDVVRIVDAQDTENPVLAVQDDLALTPQPGCLASWPSLYVSLCEIVSQYGSENSSEYVDSSRRLLVSKLAPLLQKHWHQDFAEIGSNYFQTGGKSVQFKTMKDLVHAVLRWRSKQFGRLSQGTGRRAFHNGLAPELELVSLTKYNDFELRYKSCTVDLGKSFEALDAMSPGKQSKSSSLAKFDNQSCSADEDDSECEDSSPLTERIPCGIVQQTRSMFERTNGARPSFFAPQ